MQYAPNPSKYDDSENEVYETPNAVLTDEIAKARSLLALALDVKGEDYVYPKRVNDLGVEACLYLNYESVTWEEDEATGYSQVVYSNPTGCSCIIGHVLVYAGVPFPKITEQEGIAAEEALAAIGTFTSAIVREALNKAQQKQDHPNGYTWGEAVEEFEAYINEHTVMA